MSRRLAREIAIQSLYQMEMNQVEASEAISMLLSEAAGDNESEVDVTDVAQTEQFTLEIVLGTCNHKDAIDGLLRDYLKGWDLGRLSRVDLQILRLGTYEMVFRDDVPAKVVVNEAVDLAKHFGTVDSGKFVNGVLGKMIKEIEQIKNKI